MTNRFYCDSPGCDWTGGDDDLPQYQETGEAAGVPFSITMIDTDRCPQCGHDSLRDTYNEPKEEPWEDTSCAKDRTLYSG